jgi:hypothetical protein
MSPSRPMIEPISPSVCRSASRKTVPSVSAVNTASSEYQRCPPEVVRGSASQDATASSVNHHCQTALLAQNRVIRGRVFDLALLLWNVVAAILVQLERQGAFRGSEKGTPSYVGPARRATGLSLQQRRRDVSRLVYRRFYVVCQRKLMWSSGLHSRFQNHVEWSSGCSSYICKSASSYNFC